MPMGGLPAPLRRCGNPWPAERQGMHRKAQMPAHGAPKCDSPGERSSAFVACDGRASSNRNPRAAVVPRLRSMGCCPSYEPRIPSAIARDPKFEERRTPRGSVVCVPRVASAACGRNLPRCWGVQEATRKGISFPQNPSVITLGWIIGRGRRPRRDVRHRRWGIGQAQRWHGAAARDGGCRGSARARRSQAARRAPAGAAPVRQIGPG